MEIIGCIRQDGDFQFYESEYLDFILDLKSRLGRKSKGIRNGLMVVDVNNAADYREYMSQFIVDPCELMMDFEQLSANERQISQNEYLPNVLIDFDNKKFFSSHPENYYLNFKDYLPPSWSYIEADNVTDEIPEKVRYWESWISKGDAAG